MSLVAPHQRVRILIKVLAPHNFGLEFVDMHKTEQDGVYASILHEKIILLHSYLKGLSESDECLKLAAAFNSPQFLVALSPQSDLKETLELPISSVKHPK